MKTALVIGATGLVGRELVQQLLQSKAFGKVIIFVRRPSGILHEKLDEHVINFEIAVSQGRHGGDHKHLVKGDVLFSALGTTLKQAGSKEAQYKIDFTYQYNFAAAASENKVPVCVLVSSAGADMRSSIFYSRIKGQLEEVIKKLSFNATHILQPSLLVGDRNKERKGEKIGSVVLNALNKIGLFKKYKPIHARIVAKAMINAALSSKTGVHTYALGRVFEIAGLPA